MINIFLLEMFIDMNYDGSDSFILCSSFDKDNLQNISYSLQKELPFFSKNFTNKRLKLFQHHNFNGGTMSIELKNDLNLLSEDLFSECPNMFKFFTNNTLTPLYVSNSWNDFDVSFNILETELL